MTGCLLVMPAPRNAHREPSLAGRWHDAPHRCPTPICAPWRAHTRAHDACHDLHRRFMPACMLTHVLLAKRLLQSTTWGFMRHGAQDTCTACGDFGISVTRQVPDRMAHHNWQQPLCWGRGWGGGACPVRANTHLLRFAAGFGGSACSASWGGRSGAAATSSFRKSMVASPATAALLKGQPAKRMRGAARGGRGHACGLLHEAYDEVYKCLQRMSSDHASGCPPLHADDRRIGECVGLVQKHSLGRVTHCLHCRCAHTPQPARAVIWQACRGTQ